ncbi:M10 family metallopeptidase C-terminal domain-containing protein [Microvirga sp. BT688]|uniref:M10 family metallopeptidase C-terminal domain-containing protein n=1 Tax=Microvirga sp. TaxID=1873136 RepID=UPI001687588C|nr:M10 family metallopeptidase C-terminal domain-containing protein [Microvirga sp.]MBD2747213.1 M10 family metallopeptidase C-terminal domain-containing protein [Microvirga sp.]
MVGFRTISGSGYCSAYIDALVAGGAVWDMSTGPITFDFGLRYDRLGAIQEHGGRVSKLKFDGKEYLPSTSVNGVEGAEFIVGDYRDIDAVPVLNALASASAVAQISFDVDPVFGDTKRDASTADMVVWKTHLDYWGTSGVWSDADTPQESFEAGQSQSWLYQSVYFGDAWDRSHPGGMGYTMLLNMVGKALGLRQAHAEFPGISYENDPGPLGLNQVPFTVMTGNWSFLNSGHPNGKWGSMKSFGAFDIAALQAIYGANMTTATGNNVYELPTYNDWDEEWGVGRATGWTCIWDAGGKDTITARSALRSVVIDLRAATLENGDPNAGGFISKHINVAGGFTIAKGAVIEDAVGGSGSDYLIGNSSVNKLTGGSGRDFFVFTTTPNKRTNKDTITDFKVRDDTIWLENSIFRKLGSKGTEENPAKLKAAFFKIGDKATDKNDYIIYNKNTGVLSYDADGSGKGRAVEFAVIKKNLALKYDDFAVI